MTVRAFVLTVSDGVNAGKREDKSGVALGELLSASGFVVTRSVVADEEDEIENAIREALDANELIVTTGGTGFGPRDVTPEATSRVIERQAPGLVHMMMSTGIESTPMAALSRATAGSVGDTLVINVPGSTKGAVENLQAVIDLIPHALDLLAGDTEH